jgi:hypothetical protein
MPGPRPAKDQSWSAERFADGFFRLLDEHNYCPKLNLLVLGMRQTGYFADYCVHPPRHCFARGIKENAFGRSSTAAIPIPSSLLPRLGSSVDLLEMDPGCVWPGGIVGQFGQRPSI